MNKPARHLITAALPYANGPLHIGHIAGAYLPADIYVRFLRLKGEEVAFVCGSDEHGAAITLRAKKEGVSPQEIVDKYHRMNKRAFEDFGINFDIFHRTSSNIHHQTAADFFKVLYEQGNLFEKTSAQFFDEEHEQFLADRYVTGTCPKCGYTEAYGDQCEKCGSSLSPSDLIEPKSTLSGKPPVLKETKHWYLPLNEYEDWLRKWILEEKKDIWKPNVYGQCKSWIEGGLQPRAMTRDLEWGISVPLPGAEGKVLYVWLDAPIGYISATKQWALQSGKNWEDYWKDKNTSLIHFIGKDNIVFHCIIFPILLKAHGGFILPDNVPANEFLNLEGNKISTSRNWAVWLNEYLKDFPDRNDELRYVLTAISPETSDNDFTWKDYQSFVNNELVATLGNFVNRALVLTHKYFDGKIPAKGDLEAKDKEIIEKMAAAPAIIEEKLEKFRFRDAQNEVMGLARLGNKYLAEMEPWKLIKSDESRVKTILNVALQVAANMAIVTKPFLPDTSGKLTACLGLNNPVWGNAGKSDLAEAGKQLKESALLFTKVENEEIAAQIEKLKANKKEKMEKEVVAQGMKKNIPFEDFGKLDIRIGKIKNAEKISGADKLLKLTIDTGLDSRTVVSGIAEQYKPEEIIGRKVSILLNLAPKKIRGVESQGMVLMAENKDGKLAFIIPEGDMEEGSKVR